MTFALGSRSLDRLVGVHPKLAAVVKAAILISETDFTVVEGVRPKEQMWANWGKGRTREQCIAKGVPPECAAPALAKVTWLNDPLGSKHGVHADGLGHAVDLAPIVNGAIAWDRRDLFAEINAAMEKASAIAGVEITWGGSWVTSPDLPHFELQ